MDLQDKERHAEAETAVDIIRPHVYRTELGNAFAFRVQLDANVYGENVLEEQVALINELRQGGGRDKNQMVAFQEGEKTVLGFIYTAAQFARFKEVVSKYQGSFGFGASFGDSQISLSQDPVDGQIDIIASCEATNGAARAHKSQELVQMTNTLANPDAMVSAGRYYIEEDKETTERLIAEGRVIRGPKGTLLERVPITSESFPSEDEVNVYIASHLTTELSVSPESREKLHDVTQLSVLSVDINGASKIIHRQTIELIKAQRDNKSASEIAVRRLDIEKYIQDIAAFFCTLEHAAERLISQDNPDQKIQVMEHRGDAGGVVVSTVYKQALLDVLKATLEAFPDMAVKAALTDHSELEVVKHSDHRISTPKTIDVTDEGLSALIEKHHLNPDKRKSIVIGQDEQGRVTLEIFMRDVDGKMISLYKMPSQEEK